MDAATFYPALRHTHITMVVVSGTLFAARGIGVLRGQPWSMRKAVRLASYGIDTALLSAALGMLWILGVNPFTVPWLATKITLLLVYIVLGSLALKRARTAGARRASYMAALLCYGFMISVAIAHSPWGALGWLKS